ncbi:fructose facilitator [Pseudohyphozyma bogoriensis]|nr:fructose facilitator [Pseudohyphozyma bogoriensis]
MSALAHEEAEDSKNFSLDSPANNEEEQEWEVYETDDEEDEEEQDRLAMERWAQEWREGDGVKAEEDMVEQREGGSGEQEPVQGGADQQPAANEPSQAPVTNSAHLKPMHLGRQPKGGLLHSLAAVERAKELTRLGQTFPIPEIGDIFPSIDDFRIHLIAAFLNRPHGVQIGIRRAPTVGISPDDLRLGWHQPRVGYKLLCAGSSNCSFFVWLRPSSGEGSSLVVTELKEDHSSTCPRNPSHTGKRPSSTTTTSSHYQKKHKVAPVFYTSSHPPAPSPSSHHVTSQSLPFACSRPSNPPQPSISTSNSARFPYTTIHTIPSRLTHASHHPTPSPSQSAEPTPSPYQLALIPPRQRHHHFIRTRQVDPWWLQLTLLLHAVSPKSNLRQYTAAFEQAGVVDAHAFVRMMSLGEKEFKGVCEGLVEMGVPKIETVLFAAGRKKIRETVVEGDEGHVMPSLKSSTINASFFPGADAEDERMEHAPAGTSDAKKKGTKGKKATAMRDLGDEEATVAGSGPSTRRSSVTAVGDAPVDSSVEKSVNGKKLTILHFDKGDPENPFNWSNRQKWIITTLLCTMTCFIGLSTSAYSNTVTNMTAEFGVANVVGQVGMMTFNGACAVAPLILAPLCELIGRREVYLSAYGCFVLVFLMLALGKNIETELIGRLLSGLFGSCGTILVGGTLADIWKTKDRSVPMSCFTFAAIFGTIAAPTYCGYIDMYLGWRWIEWIHMIANGCLFILEVFLLKETRGAKILSVRAKQLREETGNKNIRSPADLESESVRDLLKKSSTRAILLLVREPVLLSFGLWIAFAWGITFLFLSAIPLAFQDNRHWSEGNAGLPYLALILGCFIGFATGLWADAKYNRVTKENGGVPIPEYRLWGAMFFANCLPAGLFIFSFTQYGFVHWIAPVISLVLIILGIYHIFLAVYNYTSDSYGEMSSSAIAGQGLLRNLFGGCTPLFANQMFHGMGYQYAGLLLALVSCLAIPLPYLLFFKGEQIRAASRFAVTEVEETEDQDSDDVEVQTKRQLPAKEALHSGTLV